MWTCAKYHSEEDRHNPGSMSSPAWDHLDVRKGSFLEEAICNVFVEDFSARERPMG